MNNKISQEEWEAIAHQLACPQGEQGLALGEKMNTSNAFITECSINALAPGQDEKILEIGFGNGELSLPVIEAIGANGQFIGVETSSIMAQQASVCFKQAGHSNVTILTDDCHLIDIEKHSLDAVLAVNVLYFIDDLDALFRKIRDWLKPGGRIVMGVRSSELLRAMPFAQFGFRLRELNEIKDAMRDVDFINVESDYFDEGFVEFNELKLPMGSLVIRACK